MGFGLVLPICDSLAVENILFVFLYALVTFGVEFDKTLSAFKLHFELVKMWC
jgi:hypothetical protein